MMKIGISPITNTIFMGPSKDLGDGVSMFTGKKTDVTNDVIAAVFEWFVVNAKKSESGMYEVSYPSVPGFETATLTMDLGRKKKTEGDV